MDVAISEAKAQLTDLVRRAEAGEQVILTRDGKPAVELSPIGQPVSKETRLKLLQELRGSIKRDFGPDAARAADFLYDDFGLPA